MMYKGFEIVRENINGTDWFVAKKGGKTLVNYVEVLGVRTGKANPMCFLSESIAKKTLKYLISENLVESHM